MTALVFSQFNLVQIDKLTYKYYSHRNLQIMRDPLLKFVEPSSRQTSTSRINKQLTSTSTIDRHSQNSTSPHFTSLHSTLLYSSSYCTHHTSLITLHSLHCTHYTALHFTSLITLHFTLLYSSLHCTHYTALTTLHSPLLITTLHYYTALHYTTLHSLLPYTHSHRVVRH